MSATDGSLSSILAAALELSKDDRKLLQKYLLSVDAGLELDPESVRRSGDEGLHALWNVGARA